jgi:sec-independent protein translocase protein TatB
MVQPQTIEVASLGMWDSLILMVMALVVFGPRRLPEIGRQIGKLMYEIRKASNDFKFQMEDELRKAEDADRQKKESERLAALALAAPAQAGIYSQVSESRPGAPGAPVDSQIPKWAPGVPVPDGQFPVPSPYPEEAVYPAVSPGDFHDNEPFPRIQPPSTGEPVEAERPSRMAEAGEAPAEAKPDQAPTVTEHEHHG